MPEALTPQPTSTAGASSTPAAKNDAPSNKKATVVSSGEPAAKTKPMKFNDIDAIITQEPPPAAGDADDDDDEDFNDSDEFGDDDDAEDGEEREADDEEEEEEEDSEEEGGEEEETENDEEDPGSELTREQVLEKLSKEIGEDGKISVKVDGKKQRYTIDEMKTLVSSGQHTLNARNQFESHVKAQNVKLQEKETELRRINNELSPVYKKLKDKNIRDAIYDLSAHAGMTNLEMRRHLRQQMLPVIANYLGLSEQDVNQRLIANRDRNSHLDVEEENQFNKSEIERLRKASAPKEPSADERSQKLVRDLQINKGYSDADIRWAVGYFEKEAKASGKEPNVTIQGLDWVLTGRRFADRALDAVESVRPDLVSDKGFLDRVFRKIKDNPEWSVGKVARWVEKKAREIAQKKKDLDTQSLHKDIGRKVKKSGTLSRFENPRKTQSKPMKFSDFGDGGPLS